VKITEKNPLFLHEIHNNGSIILRNHVESVFDYLAHHIESLGYRV